MTKRDQGYLISSSRSANVTRALSGQRWRGAQISSLITMLILLVTLVAQVSHAASEPPNPDDPGPAPTICNAYAPVQPCFFTPGFLSFSLSPHILHVGGLLTGRMSWSFPRQKGGSQLAAFGGSMVTKGLGLELLRCDGPKSVANKYDEPVHGTTTCEWKALAPTGGWRLDLGAILYCPCPTSYEAGDFYAILGKNTHAIEGHVTDTAGDRLAGVPIRIDGATKGPTVVTNNAGYYYKLVKAGTYYVSVRKGSAVARGFTPEYGTAKLGADTSSVTVDFVGKLHTTVTLTPPSVTDSGLEKATLTVQALSPTDQPVQNHILDVYAGPTENSQANVIICSSSGSNQGRLEPAYFSQGTPLYLSARQTTDSKGMLTYQVYYGSSPGTLLFRADDPAVTSANGLTDVSAYSSVDSSITQARLVALPARYDVIKRGVIRSTRYSLSIDGALAAVVQGLTDPTATQQPLSLGGAGGAAQGILLRAIERSGLFKNLGLLPLTAAGGGHPGVLIYAGQEPSIDAQTRVLDLTTAVALQKYDDLKATDSAVHLPTLRQWKNEISGGTAVLDFAPGAQEQGLVYTHGLPYLPASDADLGAFDSSCLSRAAGS